MRDREPCTTVVATAFQYSKAAAIKAAAAAEGVTVSTWLRRAFDERLKASGFYPELLSEQRR
jgi:hypothetical protein